MVGINHILFWCLLRPLTTTFSRNQLIRLHVVNYTVNTRNFDFWPLAHGEISFLRISQKVRILDHMLLHKLYINVAIAHILVYSKSLYDLPGSSQVFSLISRYASKGVAKNQGWHGQNLSHFFLVFIETITDNIQQELACSKRFPSKIPN